MSTLKTYPTIEENVRARIALGMPDAPVFAAAFYNSKTRAFHDEHIVFHTASSKTTLALRAGPGSGQTPGFAHRAHERVGHTVVPQEDPELLRVYQRSDELIRHLRIRDARVPSLSPEKTLLTVPTLIDISGVSIAPPAWRPPVPPTRAQKFRVAFQNRVEQFDSFSLSVLRVTKEAHIASRIYKLCAQIAKKIRYRAVLFYDIVCDGKKLLHVFQLPITNPFDKLRTGFQFSINFQIPTFKFPPNTLSIIRYPKLSKPVLAHVGQGLIVGSLVLFLMTVGPILRLQAGEWWEQTRVAVTGKAAEPAVRETLMDVVRKPEETPPEDKQFQLLIPKLVANLKVIPNVDAGNEKSYTDALKRGVAHAAGSGLPGETNATNRTVYIFGHSTNGVWNIAKYNALFYSLKDLSVGDEIIVWFWGKEFHYTVSQVIKIDPSDLTYLAPQTTKDQLILQTCWPPGTVWKRLLVIATPVAK